MRVLVTGATGFLGSHTAAAILRAGHEVRLLARRPERASSALEPHGVEATDVVRGDITDAESVAAAVEGCDAVVHTAAVIAMDAAGAEAMAATNVQGTRTVLDAGLAAGADPVIYISSVAALFPTRDPVLTLDSPLAVPQTAYGQSKVAVEDEVRQRRAAGMPVVTFYPGGILGPHDPNLGENMRGAALFLTAMLPMTSGGYLVVDVRDLAAAITAALEPGRGPRRYLAGAHFLRWPELADVVSSVSGRRVRRAPVPGAALRAAGRAGDVVKRVVPFDFPMTHEAMQAVTEMVPTDNSLTESELGVRFRAPAETFRDTYRWLYEQGHLDAKFVPALV